MSVSDLAKLFGAAAPWVAAIVVLFLAGIVTAAFRQGREISWPPRIGPRPSSRRSTEEREALHRPTLARQPEEAVDREYPVDRARDFYQEIAPNYDLRNSGSLVSTHLAAVAQLQATRAQRSTLRVLDLGGGTGKLIAIHFFNDAAVSWTYVDFCPAMAAQFRRNLAGYPLGVNSKVVVEDLTRALQQLEPASYDVVMLSLVLSSMPNPPDFALIARVLAPGGSLIVTDINPGYTHANPLYRVSVDGAVVALRTTPVDPLDVIRRAEAAGLRESAKKAIGEGEGSTYYSFMVVFTATAVRPPDEEWGDSTLARM
jgi:ubiquinone/menaquinone biosynthesis C-methylase UbiE